MSKPHLDFSRCAGGCFPKDHCKLLLAVGSGEVLLMAFAVAPFPRALLLSGCCSTAALRCSSDLLMTCCAAHHVVFTLICFSQSNPHRKGLEKNRFSDFSLMHFVFPSEKVNICVISCRTPKAAVK